MRLLILLSLTTLFFCCKNETPATTAPIAQVEIAEPKDSVSKYISEVRVLPKKDACQFLERGSMSEIMNWNHGGVNESMEMPIAQGNQTSCKYTHKDEVLTLTIRWEDQAAQSDQAIAKRFSEYITQGDAGTAYRVLNATPNSQTIFGYATPTERAVFTIRRRVHSTMEIQLELTTPNNRPPEYRNRLIRLINTVQEY